MSRPKHSLEERNGSEVEQVGVPVGKFGVDLRDNPRGRHPLSLSELNNAVFEDDRVATRRPGHTASLIRPTQDNWSATNPELEGNWVYGFGQEIHNQPAVVCAYPGTSRGVFEHNGSVCAWTGDRIFVQAGDDSWTGRSPYWDTQNLYTGITTGRQQGIVAYLPTDDISRVRVVDNEDIEDVVTVEGSRFFVVAYLTTANVIRADTFDRETGALVNTSVVDNASTTWSSMKGVYSDGYYILVALAGGATVQAYYSTDGLTWADADMDLAATQFDIAKHPLSESWALAYTTNSTTLKFSWMTGFEVDQTLSAAAATVSTSGTITKLAVAVRDDSYLFFMWNDGSTHYGMLADFQGDATLGWGQSSIDGGDGKLTATFRRQYDGEGIVVTYYEDGDDVYIYKIVDGTETRLEIRTNHKLASKAFTIGDEVFCWLRHKSANDQTPQQIAILLAGGSGQYTAGGGSRVVARAHYGNMNVPTTLQAMSPVQGEAYKLSTAFLTTIPYSPAYSTGRTQVYRHVLDFLPQLSWAGLGDTTYLAGGTLQMFDGVNVTEASLPSAPTVSSITAVAGAGNLSTTGSYRYRIYAVYTNAVGEVVRSPGYFWPGPNSTPLAMSGDDTVEIEIDTYSCTSFGDNLQFEIYRTESTTALPFGTNFYLANTVVVPNDMAAGTITFTDVIADTELITRPQDVYNVALGPAANLMPFGAPGCQLVVAGKDRLWLSGGEVQKGHVYHSTLKAGNQVPSFSGLVGDVAIDLDGRAVTSITPLQDNMIVFQRDRIFGLSGDGPNNLGSGYFSPSQLLAAQVGATTHFGTAVTENGVVFWGDGGPRLLDGRLGVHNISAPIEPVARNLTPTGVAPIVGKREVRWYTDTGVGFLWDWTEIADSPEYSSGRWSRWSGLQTRGVVCREGQRAELATVDGYLYREDTEVSSDGGRKFAFSFATSDLRPRDIATGNNEVYQIGLLGDYRGPHTLRCWLFYNGDTRPTERITWDPSDDLQVTAWVDDETDWDDNTSPTEFASRDGVYRFVKKVRRKPFQSLRLRFSDGGCTNYTLTPYEIVLQWAAVAGIMQLKRTLGD